MFCCTLIVIFQNLVSLGLCFTNINVFLLLARTEVLENQADMLYNSGKARLWKELVGKAIESAVAMQAAQLHSDDCP